MTLIQNYWLDIKIDILKFKWLSLKIVSNHPQSILRIFIFRRQYQRKNRDLYHSFCVSQTKYHIKRRDFQTGAKYAKQGLRCVRMEMQFLCVCSCLSDIWEEISFYDLSRIWAFAILVVCSAHSLSVDNFSKFKTIIFGWI